MSRPCTTTLRADPTTIGAGSPGIGNWIKLEPFTNVYDEQGTDNYLLSAPRMRGTHQLIEWILGRVERVEVLAPSSLRGYIVERLEATLAQYT